MDFQNYCGRSWLERFIDYCFNVFSLTIINKKDNFFNALNIHIIKNIRPKSR